MSSIHPCDNGFFSENLASDCSAYSSSSPSTSSEIIDSSRNGSTHKMVDYNNSKCAKLINKMTSILSCKFKRTQKPKPESNDDCELGCTNASGADPFNNNTSSETSHYKMSETRKLAFGIPAESFSTIQDEKKARHLGEFYNNSTLSNIAKLFSAAVLISAMFILTRRILSWNWPY